MKFGTSTTDFKAKFKIHMLKVHLKLEQPDLIPLFEQAVNTKYSAEAISAIEQGREQLWNGNWPRIVYKALKSMVKPPKKS